MAGVKYAKMIFNRQGETTPPAIQTQVYYFIVVVLAFPLSIFFGGLTYTRLIRRA